MTRSPTVGDRVTNQMKYHFVVRCFLVACCSFIHDQYSVWLLSTTVCHNMWSTDIPCRLFKPSSRRASVSIVSLVTHTGISSLMVVAHVVHSLAFFKSLKRVHRYWLQCRNEKKMRGCRAERTGRQCGHSAGMESAGRAHGVGLAPGLGPLYGTSSC